MIHRPISPTPGPASCDDASPTLTTTTKLQSPPPSLFSKLTPSPVDEVFALNALFLACPSPLRVNLGIGVYRTSEGASWPLPSVCAAEQRLAAKTLSSRHDYLPIQGDVDFLRLARGVVFGDATFSSTTDLPSTEECVTSVQTISGTGANHLAALFSTKYLGARRVWLPTPTWANHHAIWELAGAEQLSYPYFDPQTNGFDFKGMMACLETQAQRGDVLLLHACAHNPTGADPGREEWMGIAEVCARKGLFVVFDLAYQGFASGDLDADAWAVRYFRGLGLEMCVAQSFSKNFGLYGQRVGALHVVRGDLRQEVGVALLSSLCHLVRGEFSMAPRNGSDLVKEVLTDEGLKQGWIDDLKAMSDRIRDMREQLYAELCRLETPGDWSHIVKQIGMFSYTGLTERQVSTIRARHHIYMLKSGRISMSGLNSSNVARVAWAINDVVRYKELN